MISVEKDTIDIASRPAILYGDESARFQKKQERCGIVGCLLHLRLRSRIWVGIVVLQVLVSVCWSDGRYSIPELGDNTDKPNFNATDRRGRHFTLEDEGKLERLHCIVGLSLRTPPLKTSKKEEYFLFSQFDPAMVFTIPNEKFSYSRIYQEGNMAMKEWKTAKNHGGKSSFWRVKSSISLGFDDAILSVGYTISNQDPYSGRRNVLFDWCSVSQGIGNSRFSHELFVSAGYSF